MIRIDQEFWRGKRVFLTGHTGFKGGWLSLWLQQMGAEVFGYALPPPTQPSLYDLCRISANTNSVFGDIRDSASLLQAMQQANPDIVIHMAAQALVYHSYDNPVETYSTNVIGVVNLLEAVRKTPGVRVVLNVTTDKCYENREWVWGYRENEPMGGSDPYSSSKGCAELVTSAYRSSFFNPADYDRHGKVIATARAGNVIGGGDWAANRLVPDMLRAISAGEAVKIRSPHAVRPWQHVLEPLSGYLRLVERSFQEGPSYGEGWNFGPQDGDTRPVSWVVETLTSAWGEGAHWILDDSPRPHEAAYLKLDCSKAWQRLQWRPTWSLEVAIRKIVRWHKDYLANKDMRAVTINQIEEFMGS